KVPRLPGKQFDQRLGRRPTEFHRQLNGRTLSAKFGMRDKVLEEPLAILRKHRKRSDQHLGMLFPIRLQTGQGLLGGGLVGANEVHRQSQLVSIPSAIGGGGVRATQSFQQQSDFGIGLDDSLRGVPPISTERVIERKYCPQWI